MLVTVEYRLYTEIDIFIAVFLTMIHSISTVQWYDLQITEIWVYQESAYRSMILSIPTTSYKSDDIGNTDTTPIYLVSTGIGIKY